MISFRHKNERISKGEEVRKGKRRRRGRGRGKGWRDKKKMGRDGGEERERKG